MFKINKERLLAHLFALGKTGLDAEGQRTRACASDTEKEGRDLVSGWMREAGLKVVVDRIGNIHGIWETPENQGQKPLMLGSHIDTVINAGQYDGCYGVLAALEIIQSLREAGAATARPLVVTAWTNEEGIRYSPDMMGSLVYAGGMKCDDALATVGVDGTVLGEELRRIGYAGTVEPGFLKPYAFVELHIEQGPIMDAEGYAIGAVEDLQGISWQKITIEGVQNHAGTTPTSYRIDAGVAAAKVITYMRQRCLLPGSRTVCTTGCIAFEPNAINVIPSKAVFTVDVRNPNEEKLREEEKALADYLAELEKTDKVKITTERLSRFEPVLFDEGIVTLVEKYAKKRGLRCRRMTSGAGQDAQMLARICPTAMIFVPSVNGISHNPREFTKEEDLLAGAEVFLDVVVEMSEAK
ncbi:Zn-dependent hydrolase [Vermiculatibacterium agrestimuris]|uniref:Zn-dependent hydrolase n=1 Tax=Vermiculatibacterium agrestimuris TaxID=2941519 RepID=UPI00203F5616|nr:Zn-dependent hydrolase [Vermiculatibacterium agrestimuris]